MTLDNWNVEDYFVDFEELPPFTGPITALPIEYKVHQINTYILGNIGGEIQNCVSSKSEIACMLLCLASIDYLAGYYFGKETIGNDFVNFMNTYFPDKYQPYLKDIYIQLRCGIMHNLSLINPWRDGTRSFRIHLKLTPHLIEEPDGDGFNRVNISLPIFWEDIKRSLVMYGHDVIMNNSDYPDIRSNFENRFNQLGGRGSMTFKDDG